MEFFLREFFAVVQLPIIDPQIISVNDVALIFGQNKQNKLGLLNRNGEIAFLEAIVDLKTEMVNEDSLVPAVQEVAGYFANRLFDSLFGVVLLLNSLVHVILMLLFEIQFFLLDHFVRDLLHLFFLLHIQLYFLYDFQFLKVHLIHDVTLTQS